MVGTSSLLSSVYIKGVTFFNGTMVNSTLDENGNNIPVTVGDDLRVDGLLQRMGAGGEYPLKVADTIIPTSSSYSLGSSSHYWNNIYARNITVDSINTTSGVNNLQDINVRQLDSQDSSYYTDLANNNISNQTKGDILYFDGGQWQRLAAGSPGQYLQTQGVGFDPGWSSISVDGVSSLVDLSDVNTATATLGNILMADGNDWESVAQTNITSVGTISSGTWEGTALEDGYISALGGASQGDVLYYNGTSWQKLSPGVNGQFLQTKGVGANPEWATGAGGGATQLLELNDVNTSTATSGNILMADGVDWESVAQTSITSVGTIGSGTWEGTAISDAYVADDITASNYLAIANDLSDLNDAGIARTNIGLGNVENTALSTWTGSGNITTVGTIGSGTWQGAAIADAQISSAGTWNSKQDGHAYLTDISGITADQGDIIYFNGTDWVDLAPGTNGQYLQTQGAAANPQWADAAGGASQLSDLSDINTSTATSGNILMADGVDWESVAQTSITSVGTIGSGTWEGTAIADAYVADDITASNYLAIANDLSDLNDAGIARTNIGLGNVENTALSTWTGSGNITTVGTIGSGTWQGAAIADAQISSAGTWNSKQDGHAYLTDISGITADQGDIIYFNGTDWVDLAPGTNGQYLQTQGAAANPQWADAAGGASGWTTSGSDVILDTITDNVGIGVASPASKLEVEQSYAGGATTRTWTNIDGDISTSDQTTNMTGLDINLSTGSQQVTGANSEATGINVDVSNVSDDGSAKTYAGKFTGGDFLIGGEIDGQSYDNSGGSGDRDGTIIDGTNSGVLGGGTVNALVDGVTNVYGANFDNNEAVGDWLKFDFGSGNARVITEATWYQSGWSSHGDWKWQGSNNNVDWTDIGSSFSLGGNPTTIQTELAGNSTGYRYYRLLGVSGWTTGAEDLYEIEFQIDGANSTPFTLLEADFDNMELSSSVTYNNAVGATNRSLAIDDTGLIGYMASSRRYKENIVDMQSTDWIYDLRPVNFNYIKDETKSLQYGLIAEEVEGINPHFVSYNENGQPETVSYEKLITPVISEVQDLKKENESLKDRVKKLEDRLNALEK